MRHPLADPEDPGVDFSLTCADCGCTVCGVDADTVELERWTQARTWSI